MPRATAGKPKRSIELYLFEEDLDWMHRQRKERRLHGSYSDIVSQALMEYRDRLGHP